MALLALKTLRQGKKGGVMKSRNWCQKERRLLHGSTIFIAWHILARHMFQQENMRDEVKNVGLGDKNAVLDIDASQEEFQSQILNLFPRLKDAGGYRFLKGNVIYSYYFSVYPYI